MKKVVELISVMLKKTPDEIIKELCERTSGEKQRRFKQIVIFSIITAVIDYFYLMINGYAGPDAVCEGIYTYCGADNEMKSLRWFIPVLNSWIGKNMVIPYMVVLLYTLLIAISVFLLCEMLEIHNAVSNILLAVAMVSFPIVTKQYAYLFMALGYSLSFLMVVLAAYLFRKRKIRSIIAGNIALIIMMGCYQAYIAAAATIVLVLFMNDIIKKRKVSSALADVGIYAFSGVVSGVINIYIANWQLSRHNLEAYERASSLSVSEIFLCLKETVGYCYQWLWAYYSQNVLGRAKLYPMLVLLIVGMTIYFCISFIREKRIIHAVLLLLSVAVVPVTMNLCAIIFPHNGVSPVMKYQYVMIIPIALAMLNNLSMKSVLINCARWLVYLDVFALIVGYSVTAIATQIGYKMAYEATEEQADLIMEEVYELDGYQLNSTKVVLGGAIDWSPIYLANQQIFILGEVESGPVFWNGIYGMRTCRRNYFLNYLGIDLGEISNEEYLHVVTSEEYKAMPVWPAQGSVAWIDDYVTVKLTDNPPLY